MMATILAQGAHITKFVGSLGLAIAQVGKEAHTTYNVRAIDTEVLLINVVFLLKLAS